jgi:hypothetical protein
MDMDMRRLVKAFFGVSLVYNASKMKKSDFLWKKSLKRV